MNIIIGNGINYEQFPDLEWNKFQDKFDFYLQKNFSNLPKDGFLKNFVKKVIISVLSETKLEEKLMFSDLEWVAKHISLDDWIFLTSDGYFDEFALTGIWHILNKTKDAPVFLMTMGEEMMMLIMSTLSMIYFTCVHMLFNDSIHDTLVDGYGVRNLEYNSDFKRFLGGFENIYSLNVDGILNKTSLVCRYPHGFLSFESPKEYYRRQMEKVKAQDPDMFVEFAAFAENMKTNPYEILFNYSSERKEKDLEFQNKFKKGDYSSYDHPLSEKVGETIQENMDINNIDDESYTDISEWSGDVIVLGVSSIGDEILFKRMLDNNQIRFIYYYGNKSEYEKIKSKKIRFMGFWDGSQYKK